MRRKQTMCLYSSTDLKIILTLDSPAVPFVFLGNWGHMAHVALKLARVSEVSVTCIDSQIIQLSVEIIHSALD